MLHNISMGVPEKKKINEEKMLKYSFRLKYSSDFSQCPEANYTSANPDIDVFTRVQNPAVENLLKSRNTD